MNSVNVKQVLAHLQTVVKRPFLQQSFRTATYVVERRDPAPLSKPGKHPSIRRKHKVFDILHDKTPTPHFRPQVNILLKEYVENVGQPGERVDIWAKTGRELILKNKAVYPTTENIKKYAGGSELNVDNYSSRYVKNTLDILSKYVLCVTMNKDNPWTLEPWHIRVSFRKGHVVVPDSAITMPKIPIKGPDMSLQGKEFYVTVTINNQEKVIVRCRICHWANKFEEKTPWVPFPFKQPAPLIFEEDKAIADQLPPIEPCKLSEVELEDFIVKMKLKSQMNRKAAANQ